MQPLRERKAANGGKNQGMFRVPKIETLWEDLRRAGVPERVGMESMRHLDRRLTDKVYTDILSLHI